MSPLREDERPLLDPTATIGPSVQPAAGGVAEVTETTRLLTPVAKDDNRPTEKEAHYMNIDRKRFWLLFGSIMFGNILAFFDTTLMASSHPVITSYFHASNAASWLSTVFYLSSTVSQPVYGRISDTVGRRSVYLLAAIIFLLSTVWCALAQNVGSFIAARAVCGLGAGGVMAISSIITSDVVKIEYRGIYQSYYNMAYGFGTGLGAALGGFLCDHFGWRAAFGIQLPFILIFILMIYFACPRGLGPNLAESQGKTVLEAFGTFDTVGAIILTLTVTGLILGINLGGNVLTWTHPVVICSLIIFLVGAIALVRVERTAARPMLPLPLLTRSPFSNIMHASFLSSIVTNSVLFNVPLFLQAVRQTTPTTSGLYLMSPLILVTLSAVFSGYFITWTRRMKPMMVTGVLCILLGSVTTTTLASTPEIPLWTLLLLIPGASLGQGFFFPAATIAVLALSTVDDTAVVTTTLGLLRSLGAIHGVAVSSWILQNALTFYLESLVTAPTRAEKEQIVQQVRQSVGAIARLPPLQKAQVRDAYSKALRVTFSAGIIVAIMVVALIVPVKLPRLQRQSDRSRTRTVTATAAAATVDEVNIEPALGRDEEETAIEDDDAEEVEQLGRGYQTLSRHSSRIATETGRRASFDTAF